MDARGGGAGAGGGEFAGTLRAKAQRIEALAVDRRAEDVNDFVGRGTCLPVEDEHVLYGTRTGQVVAIEVVPGNPEWAALQKWYSWVPDVFEPFTRLPDPRGFEPLVTAMEETLTVFGVASADDEPTIFNRAAWGNLESSQDWIQDWYGEAATQFAEFADPFRYIGNNHAAIADVLRRGAAATGEVFGNAREDVHQIADATVAALEGKSTLGGDDLVFLLSVVSAVGAFLTAVPSMGATLPIFFGAASSLASITKDTLPGGGEESKAEAVVGGHTVDGILSSMAQELSRLNRLIDEEERKIKDILQLRLSVVTDPTNRTEVEAPRPHLAELTTGSIRPHLNPPQ